MEDSVLIEIRAVEQEAAKLIEDAHKTCESLRAKHEEERLEHIQQAHAKAEKKRQQALAKLEEDAQSERITTVRQAKETTIVLEQAAQDTIAKAATTIVSLVEQQVE